ncbi:magnesium transporter [Streptomyces griseochromogenes]|uniref:Magnesium transporter n=2 Tax=Streptomyces griseochromogenes TaxID=68214 RepID=A0ABS4LV51_9ACTN|nr:CorA family divalent cation transporter [Streptomyces griseochromogenes]MBP2051294.1 magnesium transporter [Streptomyces griseochromogenes]
MMIVSVVSMPGGTIARTGLAEARERLAASDFLLVDVQLPDDPAAEGTPVVTGLGLASESPPWFGRAGEPARAEFLGDRIGLVVPVVEGEDFVHIHVLVTERHLLMLHRGPAVPLERLMARLGHESPADTAALLFLLLQGALDTFRRATVADVLAVEDLEDEMFERRRPEQVYRLARLRRRAARLHHSLLPYLQAMDEILTRRMMNRAFPRERQRMAGEFQSTGRLVLTDIQSLQEATRRAFATYSSLVSGEQNGVINRLAIVSTIFLPLTFLTGYFGMNFSYLTDEMESKAVFWLLAVGLQVVSLFAALYILHRTRIWRRLRDDDGLEDV